MTKYPFLPEHRTEVKGQLKYLPQTFEFLNNTLEKEYFLTTYESPYIDVNVFFNCCVILKHINDKYITKKFVQNYCKRIEHYLLHDNPFSVYIFLDINYTKDNDDYVMSIEEYMKFKVGLTDSHVALSKQKVNKGFVKMTRKVFAYISRRKLESKLLDKINNMKELPEGIIPEQYNEQINKIREGYALKLRNNENKPLPMIHPSNDIPPCILSIYEQINETHDIGHKQRVFLAMYLLRLNYEWDYIVSFYEKLSDYKEKETTRHLKSLKGYYVPSCEKLKGDGLCKAELDKKGRCGKIVTPIFY